jgi:hypothetical protein
MSQKTEFQTGVMHGEYLGEMIIGILIVSGSGSAIFGALKTYKAFNFAVKTYRRVNSSPEQLLEDSISAINEAF